MATRKQVKSAIREDLSTLTKENGFSMTLKKVFKVPQSLDKIMLLPSVALGSMPENNNVNGEGLYERQAEFWLEFYMDGSAEEFDDKADDLIEDVLTLFSEDSNTMKHCESLLVGGLIPFPGTGGKNTIIIPLTVTFY